MDRTNKTTFARVAADETCAGGAGPFPVSVPPSAKTETPSTDASTRADRSLRIVPPPFERRHVPVIVRLNAPDETSYFVHLMSESPAEALRFCDGQRSRLASDNYAEHLRWANNTAVAQRGLRDLRGALRTHELSRPLTSLVADSFTLGHYWHGLGYTHKELGEYELSLAEFDEARRLFLLAESAPCAASADNNSGLVLIELNRLADSKRHFARALRAAERLGDERLRREVHDSLASMHRAIAEGR